MICDVDRALFTKAIFTVLAPFPPLRYSRSSIIHTCTRWRIVLQATLGLALARGAIGRRSRRRGSSSSSAAYSPATGRRSPCTSRSSACSGRCIHGVVSMVVRLLGRLAVLLVAMVLAPLHVLAVPVVRRRGQGAWLGG